MNKKNLICTNCKAGFLCSCNEKDKVVKKENVKHPSHYLKNTGHEVVDVIDAWDLNFNLGNALKYIARAGRKNKSKAKEDLQKAIWYIEYEIKNRKE